MRAPWGSRTLAAKRPAGAGAALLLHFVSTTPSKTALSLRARPSEELAALRILRAAQVVAAGKLIGVQTNVGALARIVVRPEEAHLVARRFAERDRLCALVVPVAFEAEAAALGQLHGRIEVD